MRTRKHAWMLLAGLASSGIFASGAKALVYSEMYEMNAPPDTLAGTTFGNVLEVATGNGTNGPGGMTFSGGIATFLDDGASSGNQGYWSGAAGGAGAWMQGSSNFTADFRIKVLQDDAPGDASKSMSFWSGQGRGLKINLGGSSFVNGSGLVGNVGPGAAGFTQFRVIVDAGGSIGPANMIYLYTSTDGDVNNGNGDNNVVASTTMGGSGFSYGPPINFAIGSHSGSGTQLCNFDLDFWRVYTGGTGVQTSYTPEPASLALLALGGLPMLRRRRR